MNEHNNCYEQKRADDVCFDFIRNNHTTKVLIELSLEGKIRKFEIAGSRLRLCLGFSSYHSHEKCQTKKSGIFAEKQGQFSNSLREDLKVLEEVSLVIQKTNYVAKFKYNQLS